MNISRHAGIVALTALVSTVITEAAAAQAVSLAAEGKTAENDGKVNFSIKQQSVGEALTSLGEQSGLTIIMEAKLSRGLQAQSFSGLYTPNEALKKILTPYGLEAEYLDSKTILVRAAKAVGVTQTEGGSDGFNLSSNMGDKGVTSWGMRLAQSSAGDGSMVGNGDDQSSGKQDELRDAKLEEIVVTAQRREENLQDVPISITALTGDRLDTSSASVNEELSRVPGVAMIDGGFGASLITIRGVTATNSFLAGASTTGYYLDTVPFGFVARAFTPNANAFDLERVEVLRGPQGTLYGVSSQSGVVRVLTHAAESDEFALKFRTYVSMTEDGGTNTRGDVAVNIPVIQDRLGIRVVYGREDLSGWIDRPSAGERDINDAEITNARIRIDATPTDRLTLSAMFWRNEESYGDINSAHDDRTTAVGRRSPIDTSYDILSLTASYDFGPFVFTSATSHIDYALDGFGPAGGNVAITQHFPSEVFAEEVSLTSTGEGPWRWSIGGIYRDAEDFIGQNFVCGSTPCILPNPLGVLHKDQSRSHAVFGEVTRSLTEELDLTLGLRYFEDEVTSVDLIDPFDPNAPTRRHTDSYDSTTPRVVLTWRPTDDFTTYASYAQGFRSGLPANFTTQSQGYPPTQPDTLTSYEVGAKGSLWNDSLSYEVAAYYQEWEDIHQFLTIPFGPTYIAAVINGPSASGSGIDLGLTWRPLRNLSLSATYSWNDLTFDTDVLSGNPPEAIARKGDRLGDSPEINGGLSGEYQFSLGGGFEANFSAGVNHVSSRVGRGILSGNLVEVAGDDIVTARARFAVVSPSGWTISLFGENLNDFDGTPTPVLGTPPETGTNRIRPRTAGLQFEYQLK